MISDATGEATVGVEVRHAAHLLVDYCSIRVGGPLLRHCFTQRRCPIELLCDQPYTNCSPACRNTLHWSLLLVAKAAVFSGSVMVIRSHLLLETAVIVRGESDERARAHPTRRCNRPRSLVSPSWLSADPLRWSAYDSCRDG